MVARSELQLTLHRMSNYLECSLSDVFRDLLAEGRPEDASEIAYTACNLIEKLRDARDESEGSAK
jgi:hypothetical protein